MGWLQSDLAWLPLAANCMHAGNLIAALSTLFKVSALNLKLQLPIFMRFALKRFKKKKKSVQNQLPLLIMRKCWSSYAFEIFDYFFRILPSSLFTF